MNWGMEKSSFWKAVNIALCLILSAVFSGFLIWNHISEEEDAEKLKKIVEENALNAGKTDDIKEIVDLREDSLLEDVDVDVHGISCWGDEFFRGDDVELYSYRVILQGILEENGYNIQVIGKTLSGASTLSMMKMAGIDQSELDEYIEKHREEADEEEEIPVTEVGIRPLSEEQILRDEKDYLPVIFMGYYGGWNYDALELIEQQHKILDTFMNQDKFLILGCKPLLVLADTREYHRLMENEWGEHYINTQEITDSPESIEGQELIGKAIYEKLVKLNYIERTE